MGIPCAKQPLIVEFKGGITINYPMEFNQDTRDFLVTQTGFPIDKLGVALNTSDLVLKVEEVIEKLDPPIDIPVNCNPKGSISVSDVTVNQVSVHGAIQFVANADLFDDNTIPTPTGVNLAWPATSGTIYIDKTLLSYTDNLTDQYNLSVALTDLQLDSARNEGDSNLYVFVIAGTLSIEAIKK
ncbi:hypothetical protein [Romboutsia lituseburensis]|uniref:hypothetical protein n=1 Tax=Romboutsia lituseburensis TaxID=1537 RepID=UPI00215B48E8|nr:hypothetical protein [Romboutsia lituseburensis]MCR8744745.1 hypothetical protein [Romboutsia lituseburensis]